MPRTYILESDSIDRLLIRPGRNLLGLERQRAAYEATVTWCRALLEHHLLPANPRDICTVTVLAEGIGHNLPGALATVLAPNHSRGDNWIGVSRFPVALSSDSTPTTQDSYTAFDARVNYIRIHSPASVWCVIDTVATGATLVRGLEAAFAQAPKPREILLATPAGSAVGMRKIAELCAREHVALTLTFFGAIFGLWHDGTGLPWCHPDTVISGTPHSRTNRALAQRIFNNLPGFCAVGDCSANFFDVDQARRNLHEEEERFNWKLAS